MIDFNWIYYPYGSLMGEGFNASSQPYRYGGKELVTLENLNLSDFGARWLDTPTNNEIGVALLIGIFLEKLW